MINLLVYGVHARCLLRLSRVFCWLRFAVDVVLGSWSSASLPVGLRADGFSLALLFVLNLALQVWII